MTYVKQMRLVKKVCFSMPALTYGAWQHTEVGTGLGGQLPFTGSAKSLSAHALKTHLPACVQPVHSIQCN